MVNEEFCGEMERRNGRPEASGRIGWFLAAVPVAWAFRLAIVALIGAGCAHTGISRSDDCGSFSSTVVGVPPFYTPAGQYATYAQACGNERFSRVIAAQRLAVVAGARAAVGGGRDELARKEIARTQRDLGQLAATVAEGGAR